VEEVKTNSEREMRDYRDSAIVEIEISERSCGAENQINNN